MRPLLRLISPPPAVPRGVPSGDAFFLRLAQAGGHQGPGRDESALYALFGYTAGPFTHSAGDKHEGMNNDRRRRVCSALP